MQLFAHDRQTGVGDRYGLLRYAIYLSCPGSVLYCGHVGLDPEREGVKATMATEDSKRETAGSALVRELSQNAVEAADKKEATTLRLRGSTLRRLKEQERRWNTSMSLITERALSPVLDELEAAELPDIKE